MLGNKELLLVRTRKLKDGTKQKIMKVSENTFGNSVEKGNECMMNRWITNEQAEKQVILYPPSEKTFYPSMRPAHAQSPMRFVHLTAIPLAIRDNCCDESRRPEVDLWAEGMIGVRHHESVCRVPNGLRMD